MSQKRAWPIVDFTEFIFMELAFNRVKSKKMRVMEVFAVFIIEVFGHNPLVCVERGD